MRNMISLTRKYPLLQWILNKSENDRIPQCEFCLSTELQNTIFSTSVLKPKLNGKNKKNKSTCTSFILDIRQIGQLVRLNKEKQSRINESKRYGAFTFGRKRERANESKRQEKWEKRMCVCEEEKNELITKLYIYANCTLLTLTPTGACRRSILPFTTRAIFWNIIFI